MSRWSNEWSLAPLEPKDWSRAQAGHLLRRASFGARFEELDELTELGPQRAVDHLLAVSSPRDDGALVDRLTPLLALDSVEQLQSGWIHRMVHSPSSLRERLALFWHDHFATSNAKVQSVARMHAQNRLLTREALGSLRELLIGISRDPAMIRWLDNDRNWKDHPNENYARELMELFSLGRGNYTEQDVQQAARAFSGWHTRGDAFYFDARGHDDGEKEILGVRGRFGGEEAVERCLAQPACARFIVDKLARDLWRPDPAPEAIEALAEVLRKADYDIAAVLSTLLRSQAFFHPAARRSLVKSPVHLVVGALRALGGRPLGQSVAQMTGAMGQRLFEPPSVKGWDGGKAWINTATMIARTNFAARLTGLAGAPVAAGVEPAALARASGASDSEAVADFLIDLLIDGQAPLSMRQEIARAVDSASEDEGARLATYLVLVSPEYQLA